MEENGMKRRLFVRRTEEFKTNKTNEKSKSVVITNSPPAPPPAAAPLVAAPFALVSLNQLRTMNKKIIFLFLVIVSTNNRWMGHVLESMVGTVGEKLDNFFRDRMSEKGLKRVSGREVLTELF